MNFEDIIGYIFLEHLNDPIDFLNMLLTNKFIRNVGISHYKYYMKHVVQRHTYIMIREYMNLNLRKRFLTDKMELMNLIFKKLIKYNLIYDPKIFYYRRSWIYFDRTYITCKYNIKVVEFNKLLECNVIKPTPFNNYRINIKDTKCLLRKISQYNILNMLLVIVGCGLNLMKRLICCIHS